MKMAVLVRVVALLLAVATAPTPFVSAQQSSSSTDDGPTNVLFIVLDQLRFDTLGFVQSRMPSRYGSNVVKVRTPNIDRIATTMGLSFETAYCQMPICCPARATLKTGCTVARHGIVSNGAVFPEVYTKMSTFRNRVESLVSFEQIVQQNLSYRVETYGKWHTPLRWYNNAIHFNYYSYRDQLFHFAPEMDFQPRYLDSLNYFNKSAYETLEQTAPGTTLINRYSKFPYTPIQIDAREMAKTATTKSGTTKSASTSSATTTAASEAVATLVEDELATSAPTQFFHYNRRDMALAPTRVTASPIDTISTEEESPINTMPPARLQDSGGFERMTAATNSSAQQDDADASGDRGRDALAVNYTSSAIEGDMALRALRRLVTESTTDPFFLSVHFLSPHPPMVATNAYLSYYWNQRSNLYIPPSISDTLIYSAYRRSGNRKPGFTDPVKVKELVAVYYAMIEEVDHHIGQLIETLEASGMLNSTMIIVTSDHGEMMGAHGMQGKSLLYEEAARVPLIMSSPRHFPSSTVGTVIKEPVSHLDLHATILDYLGALQYDTGDGTSLRRFIERTSYNQYYDERVVVVEIDGRNPSSATKMGGKPGDKPNFLIRKGPFVLTLARSANSTVMDMMYNLELDPGQVVNLLLDPKSTNLMTRSTIVGKAEHLKILLLEFMTRHDGAGQYYSNPKYQLGGRGDITEITFRRTWGKTKYWQSDATLSFGTPAKIGSQYVRNEYWYVGRSASSGTLQIQSVTVSGANASYFQVSNVRRNVLPNKYVRIKVSFNSSVALDWTTLQATLLVKNSETGVSQIPLVFEASS